MRVVGIKVLKNKPSEYVRMVAATGETVLVMDRDRVVAELVPPRAARGLDVSGARLAEAARRGWLTPPLGEVGPVPAGPPVARLADIVAEVRGDRDAG
jgi:antitoxin (DNA-binding transcriptional repressor) of toxin-antitoxin stability system